MAAAIHDDPFAKLSYMISSRLSAYGYALRPKVRAQRSNAILTTVSTWLPGQVAHVQQYIICSKVTPEIRTTHLTPLETLSRDWGFVSEPCWDNLRLFLTKHTMDRLPEVGLLNEVVERISKARPQGKHLIKKTFAHRRTRLLNHN